MRLVQGQVKPCDDAVSEGDGKWLVINDDKPIVGAVLTGTAVHDAVPIRDDLPVGHPLRGKRALKNVPAGLPDVVVTALGVLTCDVSQAQIPDDEPIGEVTIGGMR